MGAYLSSVATNRCAFCSRRRPGPHRTESHAGVFGETEDEFAALSSQGSNVDVAAGLSRRLDGRFFPLSERQPYLHLAGRAGVRPAIAVEFTGTSQARSEELSDSLLSRHYAQRGVPIPSAGLGCCLRVDGRARSD